MVEPPTGIPVPASVDPGALPGCQPHRAAACPPTEGGVVGYKVITRLEGISVVERTKTNFRVRWSESGRRFERSFTTKAAANKFARELADALEEGGGKTPPTQGLFAELVVDAIRPELHPRWSVRHLKTYEGLAKNWIINEPVGEMKAKAVTPEALNRALNHVVVGMGYAVSTARHVKNILRMACERGVELGIWTEATNPMRRVVLPSTQAASRTPVGLRRITKTPSASQVAALAEHFERVTPAAEGYSGGSILVRFAAETGLRQGEQLGLAVEHLDLERGYVHVERSVARDFSGRPMMQDPKTATSTRNVPLTDAMVVELRELCTGKKPTDLVFTARRGGIWNRSYLNTIVRSCPEYDGYRWHDLRHYRASALIAAGADTAAVSAFMGHASAYITLTMYTHSSPQAVEGLRALL